MHFLAVNFHYIHGENLYPHPGIHPTPVLRFRAQLETLGRIFEFVDAGALIAAVRGGKSLPDRACMITFDDGLSCQYDNAVPVLEELKIPAIFFTGGKNLAEGKAIFAHKVHWVRAHTPPELFLSRVESCYEEFTGKKFDPEEFAVLAGAERTFYLYDNAADAKIKLILNRLLSADLRERIINWLFSELVPDEREFSKKFYMSPRKIDDLLKRRWLGIHGYSHTPLSSLSPDEIKDEYVRCIGAVAGAVGRAVEIKAVSYPHGSPEAFSAEAGHIAARAGLLFGFTMERSFNRTLAESLLFARLDTNDAPGGKFPMFSFEDGKFGISNPALKERRGAFIKE